MFGTSSSWLCQQHSTLESSALRNCMITPIEIRQHEFLPASADPRRVSTNSNFNEFDCFGWPGRGLMGEGNGSIGNSVPYSLSTFAHNKHPEEQISLFPTRDGEKLGASEAPDPLQRKFLVFDQSGDETRLMFTSACPRGQTLQAAQNVSTLQAAQNVSYFWNPQVASAQQFDGSKLVMAREGWKVEQAFTKMPILCEESGDNETLDLGSDMRENTEEINALLYSDDEDDDCGNSRDEEGEDDEEVSSGHSPLPKVGVWQPREEQTELDFDSGMASSSTSVKRRKLLDGGHEKPSPKTTTETEIQNQVSDNIHDRDLVCALDDMTSPNIGSKRSRKDKIRETLKLLKSIMPHLKNEDPISILDEAISYLKSLKYNAEMFSAEDSDTSCSACYEPLS